jgi:DNA-binding winged helix-turn-helix (wHTH) protein/predicted ATPase
MRETRCFVFEPFRLDTLDERLWRRDQTVPLGRKAFVVLQRLISQSGRLVTKDDLLASAWPGTAVSDAVLTTAMRELRQALGDEARRPRYVQTVHGRGYRFLPLVSETTALAASQTAPVGAIDAPEGSSPVSASALVGRDLEQACLREWLAAADAGSRRVAFVAGEAGIGKTTLVDAFVARLGGRATVARGQCIDHYGVGEAYLPLLEALGRLGRESGSPLRGVLRRHAPSWLAHLPSIQSPDEAAMPGNVLPVRMLRELAEALEILTADRTLVLVLEDLHWSDTATLDCLASIARRRDRARLLVVATYRPVDAGIQGHPLRNLVAELRSHPQCAELVLDSLSEASVETWLRQCCGNRPGLARAAQRLHRRTGGLPLFFTAMAEEVTQELAQPRPIDADESRGVPTSVRQFIEHRFEQLSVEDQAILEAASVAGDSFPIAAVAAVVALSEEQIDRRCAAWTREARLLSLDTPTTWPDGTVATRYRFRHALFQEVAYARIAPERRGRCHASIGRRLEQAYGPDAPSIAAELAMHFAEAGDLMRAIAYLAHAARNALRRSAYAEAHRHVTRALAAISQLPQTRARARSELMLSLLLAQVLETIRGWGVVEVDRAYARARALSAQLGDVPHLIQATWGLMASSIVRAEIRRGRTLAREVLRLALERRDSVFRMAAHVELGGTAFVLGDVAAARTHFAEADRLYDPDRHAACVARFGADMGLLSRIWATHLLWQDGYPELARAAADETWRLARALGHPFTQTITLAYAAMLAQFAGDHDAVDDLARLTIGHATEHGFAYYLAWANVIGAWSRVSRGGDGESLVEMRRNIEILRATAGLRMPYYRALLADACLQLGRTDEGLGAISDAFATIDRTGERWWAPELHRLRGALLLASPRGRPRVQEAERCFQTAIRIARRHGAKSLELRAVVSLARLWRGEARAEPARALVSNVSAWFDGGLDTPDLRDARAMLR